MLRNRNLVRPMFSSWQILGDKYFDMRTIIALSLFLFVNCAGVKNNIANEGMLTINESDLDRLISTLPVDPTLEIPLHIVIENRNDSEILIRISQSSFSSRADFDKKFQHEGRDVFLYDFSKESDSDKVIFFNQDSPTCRIIVYRYMKIVRFFKMEEIDFWQ